LRYSFLYFCVKHKILKRIFFLFLILIPLFANTQIKKIIYSAKIQDTNEEKYPGATLLIGNVIMNHEGAILTCQQALYYKKENFFKAIGNVLLKQGDTITQTSDYVDYDGNLKQALSWGNVVLKDPTMILTSDTLQFDRLNQKLYYKSYATIKDQTNTLRSKYGNYYLENKKFTATTQVNVLNPEHNLQSTNLDYYTDTGLTYFYGATTITNSKNKNRIYSEKGFYNTKTDISHFVKNAKLFLKERTIQGDSLYYDKNRGFASATNNIIVKDTLENFLTKGNYAELFELKDSLFIIKKAVAITIIDKDSMFVHGDTLLVTGKPDRRIIRIFNNVKIFKSDLQGKCDSIHTNQSTGLTRMFKTPVLWADENQITGDTIHLLSNIETEKLDSLKVLNNSFINSKDSLSVDNFNQIKGRNIYGKFKDNSIKTLLVKGNAESLYYNRNEKNVLESITKEISSNIEFTLTKGAIESIKYLKTTEGKTYPVSQLPEEVRKLKGFIWRENEQPKRMIDIFSKMNVKKSNIKSKKIIEPIKSFNTNNLHPIKGMVKVKVKEKVNSGLIKK